MNTEDHVRWFRTASPYINSHRHKVFVLALRGEVFLSDSFNTLAQDIVLLHSLGVRLILCLGGEPQIHTRLATLNLKAETEKGVFVCTEENVEPVADCMSHLLRQLQAALIRCNTGPEKLAVVSGNYVSAKPLGVMDGRDFQRSGEVRHVNAEALRGALQQGSIVLLDGCAHSLSGEMFHINLNELASKTAIAVSANKLILFSSQDGLLSNDGELLREVSLGQANALLNSGEDLLYSAARCAIEACDRGVDRAHIVNYTQADALLTELFSRDGSGTLVSRQLFEDIRAATIEDITAILELIEPLEQDGTMVRRSREKLEAEVDYFKVIERDKDIIACAALYPIAGSKAAELACVATHADYRGAQRGAKLLLEWQREAKTRGIEEIFVLTTRTGDWFKEQGFTACGTSQLPESRQVLYNQQRNSKVFRKKI